MKEPLDYLRKAIPSLTKLHKELEKKEPEYVKHSRDVMQAARKAVKFVMPANGQIFDSELAGLPDIVKLPYKSIVIEYECHNPGGMASSVFGDDGTEPARKRIVYAEQVDNNIYVASIVAFQKFGVDHWQIQPYISIMVPKPYVPDDAVVDDMPELNGKKTVDQIRVQFIDMGGVAKKRFGDDWERHAYVDMVDEEGVVLSLIEALTCRNVSLEALPVKKNKGAQMRGALPYDEYHTLVINARNRAGDSSEDQGGTHRSPREHLRRGHIRRLPTGNVWVNSTIVNAGFHGKVIKSYEVAA